MLTVAEATDYRVWERLQISVVVPDMRPAAGAVKDDREVVQCATCGCGAGYKVAARWLEALWRSSDVEQHGPMP